MYAAVLLNCIIYAWYYCGLLVPPNVSFEAQYIYKIVYTVVLILNLLINPI